MGRLSKAVGWLKKIWNITVETKTRIIYDGIEHNEKDSKVCLECLLIDSPQTKKLVAIGNGKGVLFSPEWRANVLGKENVDTGELNMYLLNLPKGDKAVLITSSNYNLEVGK